MSELYKVEGEMLTAKVEQGLESVVSAYRTVDGQKCEELEEYLADYLGTAGVQTLGYYVEKIQANWKSQDNAALKFPTHGCMHLGQVTMTPEEIREFLNGVDELTAESSGYLSGPYIYWTSLDRNWLRPTGRYSNVIDLIGQTALALPFDWCIFLLGSGLCLHLWGRRL
jgi:hypothetical protein